MEINPIHTLENVVITLLNQKECDLQKIREYFDKRFAEGQPLDSEDFKKAYMYTFFFKPSKTDGNQRLIYRTIQGRLMLKRRELLGAYRVKKITANQALQNELSKAITMLEILPEMIGFDIRSVFTEFFL